MYQPVSTTFYWPITTKYQLLPPSTDPVPSYINQYHSILTQYHQVSTNTNLYCCCLGITDFCIVYPGSCFTGSCIGRWDQASGFFCLEPVLRRQLTGSEPDRWSKANGIMPTLFFVADFHPKMFRDAALIIIHLHNVCLSIPSLEVTWVPIPSLNLPCLDFLCELIT